MISKERLEELIKQCATIYDVCWYNVYEEKLGSNHFVGIADDEISLMQRYNGYERELIDHAKNLFEIKEEAEWFAEFGDIERTERLELPNWEEKNCIIYTFYSPIKKGGKQYEFRLFKGGNITIWRTYDMYQVFNESATKENYTIACRKAKELFLGTEDEK